MTRDGGEDPAPQPRRDGISAPTPRELARRLEHPSIRAPLAIALTDAEGHIQWINAAFTRQTGYQAAEVIGRNRLDLFRGPVTRTGELQQMRAGMAAGQLIDIEFQAWTKAGHPYWVSCVLAPTLEDDRVESYVFAEEDITQRRRSEDTARSAIRHAEELADALREERELLVSVLSTIPHVVFWKDTEGRYLGCNDAYLHFRGISSAYELVGLRDQELSTENEFSTAVQLLEERVASTGAAVIDHSALLPGPDGGRRTVLLSVLPRHTGGEAPEGIIGVGADVTRVSELERQLAQATRLESIGQLAAGLAHEINTPVQYVSDNVAFLTESVTDLLNAMQAVATIATKPEDDPDIRARLRALVDGVDLEMLAAEVPGALEQTMEGVDRVAEIIRAMKEFSHPGQGRVDTDLNRAVETTAQVCRNEWKYVAELNLDLDPELGDVQCYEGELKQVILNLIVNAAHAVADHRSAGAGGLGRIDVVTRREADMVTISIGDDGIGMDEATQERIFDPFFTTKSVGKGTGQGLAMAHGCIVGKHGGSIDVVSTPGKGSTFTIHLPVTAPNSE